MSICRFTIFLLLLFTCSGCYAVRAVFDPNNIRREWHVVVHDMDDTTKALVLKGAITKGMKKDRVRGSWGCGYDIYKRDENREEWIYNRLFSANDYVIFVDGKVSSVVVNGALVVQ